MWAVLGVKKISNVRVAPRVTIHLLRSLLQVDPVTLSAVSASGKSVHADQKALALAIKKAKANNFNIFS